MFSIPSTNSIRTILDIYNSDKVNKQINELSVSGDTIFISTEFGLSLIDSKSFVFYDTYYKFGNLSSNIRVISTFKHNLIYACYRIWNCRSESKELQTYLLPNRGMFITTSNGLSSNYIRKVRLFRDTIIAATDKGLSMFNGTSWQTFLPSFNNISIIDILVSNDSLLISHGNSISVYYQGNLIINIHKPV